MAYDDLPEAPTRRISPADIRPRTVVDVPIAGLFPSTEHRHYFLRVRETERVVDDDTVMTEYLYKCICGERVEA